MKCHLFPFAFHRMDYPRKIFIFNPGAIAYSTCFRKGLLPVLETEKTTAKLTKTATIG